jgi:hypothetical protein
MLLIHCCAVIYNLISIVNVYNCVLLEHLFSLVTMYVCISELVAMPFEVKMVIITFTAQMQICD